MTANEFASIETAIEDMANGKMVIVVDDEDRENEGDLVMAAHFVTPEAINFMIKEARGLVCVPVTDTVLDQFELTEMVQENKESQKTAFTVSFDASEKHGISTGISPFDRSKSIQVFINPKSKKDDVVTPGHLFPLRARKMGVLKRAGHTEAAVDLARLAGLAPAGVICEIINENGEMARVPDLVTFAKKHKLNMVTIQDLIHYRVKNESFVTCVETVDMPTDYGDFKLTCYKDILNDKYHYALTYGDFLDGPTLVRVHSECITGDVFGSLRCDCGPQLGTAMTKVAKNGSGVVLYMSQEGRGIGIANKLKAYKLQEQGLDTVEANEKLGFNADLRDYGVGAQMLRHLGVTQMRLMTNNPRKIVGLEGYGLEVVERVSIKMEPGKHNKKYLSTKKCKLGHMLEK
ncbi:bifunctional 3,4-dihydroxy-2-butanone-4-phosphate synthase/GTP cyclohydrolase II [Candidatus Marinamargulisbacteria bacterium SCGC AG-414-C22]|nr:bifunctional 3,4-dihydroxy-2-butanone-4-phosphate synthase/GTP cyclohydrolase II [Candidatus Marinamargulisbacteria bacterium SCGC AG-414-C22]